MPDRNPRPQVKEQLLLTGICLLVVLVSLGVAVWTLAGGQIGEQGVDALFLLAVCLLVAGAFAFMPIQAIRQGVLKDLLSAYKARRAAKAVPTEAAPTEASAAPPAEEPGEAQKTSRTA